MSGRSNKKQDPDGMKGGAFDLEEDLDSEDSPCTAAQLPVSHWPASNRPANNTLLPDSKNQVHTVQQQQPAATASNRPNNNDLLPDFKDQVRNATPLNRPANNDHLPNFEQHQGEEDSAIAPNNQTHDHQQHQEPQALLGGNGQEPSVVAFAQATPIEEDPEALAAGGGVVNQQTTVLRKHIVWAVAAVAVVLGMVVAIVVAVVLTSSYKNSSSSSGGGGPTPSPALPPVPTGSPPTDSVVLSENSKLTAGDGAAGDWFGISVAIGGDTIVVGANRDDDSGSASGSAFVFTRTGTTWTQQAKLTASDGAANDEFGFRVAIAGDTIVVGAYLDDGNGTDSGSAYVYMRTGTAWTQQAILTARDTAPNDWFGRSVAIAGDTIVVGALQDNDNGTYSGSAFVFTHTGTTWMEQAKLTASDGAAYDEFGFRVAIAGDTIVVGAVLDDDNGSQSGSAYVFSRRGNTWMEQAKLTASNGVADDRFGTSLAIVGDTIVVGAYLDDENGTDSGSAYVFTGTGTAWTQQAKLIASDGGAGDQFGRSVAIAGDTIVVGADENDLNDITDSGSAYVFMRTGTTWMQQAQLTASDATLNNEFGFSVAIDVDTIVVGAHRADNDIGNNIGSAYIYDLN